MTNNSPTGEERYEFGAGVRTANAIVGPTLFLKNERKAKNTLEKVRTQLVRRAHRSSLVTELENSKIFKTIP